MYDISLENYHVTVINDFSKKKKFISEIILRQFPDKLV